MANERQSLRAPNPSGDAFRLTFAVVVIVVLFAICIGAPLLAAIWIHPAAGAVVAIVAMIAWVYLGPPPMPGLVNGIIALQGLFALFIVFVVCVICAVISFWA